MLRGQLVCVRLVVHVIVHNGLKGVVGVRSHFDVVFVREYRVQDTFPLHPPSVNVDCRQRLPIS